MRFYRYRRVILYMSINMWVKCKTRKSTMSTAQQRYLQKKRKDPEYRDRVNQYQRELYRKAVADPVSKKQMYERKKRSREKYEAKQRLEREQVVNNEAMTDKDDGIVLDRKEEGAVPVVGGHPPEASD